MVVVLFVVFELFSDDDYFYFDDIFELDSGEEFFFILKVCFKWFVNRFKLLLYIIL